MPAPEPYPQSPDYWVPSRAMLIHAVTNTYMMPDNIGDIDNDYNDQAQNYWRDPLPADAAVVWNLSRLSNGAYRISSTHGTKHLTLADDPGYNGQIRLRRKQSGLAGQHWYLITIPGLSDSNGSAPVRALVGRNTSYAIGLHGNNLSKDTEVRLIRMWNGRPSIYHGWMLVPVPEEEEAQE